MRFSAATPRDENSPLTQREMDLAASIQAVTDEVVLRLTRSIARETGAKNLCLAGGVALNCVANGKIVRDGKVRRVLGAAGGRRRRRRARRGARGLPPLPQPAAPAAQRRSTQCRVLSRPGFRSN